MSQFKNEAAVWRYNGVEFELDLMDVDTIELYEKAFAKMQQDTKNIPKTGGKAEIVHGYCKVLRDLFDRLLGDGASAKLVGEKDNAAVITACYEDFLSFVAAQNQALNDTVNRISARYSPNRAQRRHPGK